jgi:hypothetical protein
VCLEEPSSPEWLSWREATREATIKLVNQFRAGGRPEIRDNLYKQMRSILFDAFFGKCAYCEAHFALDQTGDVEHYRPKAGVMDEHDQRIDHPGYYWLAYEWSNLLPSCSRCNRLTKTNDGRRVGKGERFPVMGNRATAPGEEANEQPLFLHPYVDDPELHLRLDPETGILAGLTPRGRACVELLDLNREGLPEARRQVYEDVRLRLATASMSQGAGDPNAAIRHVKYLSDYKRGKAPYSCAGRKAIKDATDDIRLLLREVSRN